MPALHPLPLRTRTDGSAGHRRWRREAVYFLLAYLVYVTARWVFVGDPAVAQKNASWVWELEAATGTAIEGSVQRAFSSDVVSAVLSNVYLAAQLAVLPLAIVWVYRRSPAIYRKFRTTVIATWMISVPIFALFPVAPPRLAELGLADTVSTQVAVVLNGSSTMFYNPFAAVPSLHVGFAFAVGVAVAFAARTLWLRAVAALWGPLVTLTVVATANHYVFDVVVGLLVTLAGFTVWHLHEHRLERFVRTRAAVA
jgi:hypothetical protein